MCGGSECPHVKSPASPPHSRTLTRGRLQKDGKETIRISDKEEGVRRRLDGLGFGWGVGGRWDAELVSLASNKFGVGGEMVRTLFGPSCSAVIKPVSSPTQGSFTPIYNFISIALDHIGRQCYVLSSK